VNYITSKKEKGMKRGWKGKGKEGRKAINKGKTTLFGFKVNRLSLNFDKIHFM
jgi:hypothetical protein